MGSQSPGWLAISTDGFAAMNAARPPEHLIKELVQNSLDSIAAGQAGWIQLSTSHDGTVLHVHCADNGSGIDNLADLRVVYLTHKTDSHQKRGRFGRGFKEALCIAQQALVISGGEQLHFLLENGERITRQSPAPAARAGTRVSMQMAWPAEVVEPLDRYFARFLVPSDVALEVNGRRIPHRPAEHVLEASLTTEIYDATSQSWKKPRRRTAIHLVRCLPEETPTIYEMGIPVAELEWSVPFHADIQQRVPMNPNRDAVASGYGLSLQVACLPALLAVMDADTIKQDWVGQAGRRCSTAVQQQIIERAFGSNIARSVPRVGNRHSDEDARDLGVQVINTAQTSGGFREMLRLFVPSAQELVRREERAQAAQVGSAGFSVAAARAAEATDPRQAWITRQGGEQHVERCLAFAVWFCQQLVASCPVRQQAVSGQLTLNTEPGRSLYAHWSEGNVLTLALDQDCFWQAPLGPKCLQVLIHEAAHAMAMHHGYEFRQELERLAGVAASLMLQRGGEIRERFEGLSGAVRQ